MLLGMLRCGMEANYEVCPMALAQNDNVVNFANVDGSAFIFAETSLEGTTTRAELDEIYTDSDLSFMTARHSSTVDLETYDGDFDMLFIYN